MTALRFIQLRCEGQSHGCRQVYPLHPIANTTAKELRAQAAATGWEVLRHTKGRDTCPPCRVHEISELAGAVAGAAPTT